MANIFFAKPFLASLFILNLFLAHHHTVIIIIIYLIPVLVIKGDDGSFGNIDCGAACKERCRLASRQKMCLRACGTCCERCQCVPPGPIYGQRDVCRCYAGRCHCPPLATYGDEEVCPCYRNMTTHGGRLKCP